MASKEIESFRLRFEYEFDRLLETLADLDEEAANWKPPVPGANSLLVLLTHALASAEDNVVRRGAGKTVVRDRDAEFAASGGTAHLVARANEVRARIADALAGLEGRLDEEREATFGKWPARWTVRDSLLHAVSHTAEHAGHAQLTRDQYNARRGST
jgi:uncharacterized damage-inducible protein DinB